MREFFALCSRSGLSLVGAAVTTLAAVAFLALFAMQLAGAQGTPYVGILAFLVVPGFFIFGLVLIPLGAWLARRRRRLAGDTSEPTALILDFNLPATKKVLAVVLPLTALNLVIVSTATYKGVEVMDSTEFCGGACHTVMNPEHTTYLRSPHSRVKCTECHIGEGADWFVKSKLSGAWQLVSVAFDLYPRPIPTPVHNLRPARETCEQCHLPTRFVGERLRIRERFEEDETTTASKTVVLVNVGGVQKGKGRGIHWHVDPNIEIRYRSDERRQDIYDIEYRAADGTVRTYLPESGTPDDAAPGWRTMDCIDCHNRPTHIYQYVDEALDEALASGTVDRELPFIKREGLRLLKHEYASHEEARTGMQAALAAFYEAEYPDLAKEEAERIEQAAMGLWDLYRVNVFPEMKITWGTYPNFAYQHVGCFRCHDKKHATEDGKKISARCDMCHTLLAEEEQEPEILDILYP